MKKIIKLTLAASLVSSVVSTVYAEEKEALDEINVVAQDIKEQDKVFIKTGAVSTRDNISSSTKSLDDIVRSVPGAFTQLDKSQGTVSVNVRGLTGFGRVNTMIDGVSQTFYSSSTDDGGRGGSTSQFGTFIDPDFLAAVDVERGAFNGTAGVNALMGAANFKTIGVEDLVRKGRHVGLMTKMLGGKNAIGPNYMGAVAGKVDFSDTQWLGVLYGYSWRKISQDYEIGGGKRVTDSSVDLSKLDEDEQFEHSTKPYNPEHSLQRPKGQLAKIEYGDTYNRFTLAHRDYRTSLAGRKVINKNYQLNYNFTVPDSKFINLNLLLAKNKGMQNYHTGAKVIDKILLSPLITTNTARIADVSNKFKLNFLFGGELETTIGFNKIKNEYSKNRYPEELNYLLENGETTEETNTQTGRQNLKSSTFQPDGKQDINTVYIDNNFTYGIYSLDLNANWNQAKFSGTRFRHIPDYIDQLEREADNLSIRDPKRADIYDQIDELTDQYCDVLKADDDPICEGKSLKQNVHGKHKNVNYSASLSANIHELFAPFISYSKTNRVPNIKEIFFSNIGDYGVNTDLKSETAKTYQVGFNGFKEGLLKENDLLGFKVLAYKTHIDNYIFNIGKEKIEGRYIYHKNSSDRVKIKGVEFELNYDLGWFYTKLAYAYQKTNQPASYTDASNRVDEGSTINRDLQGFGASKISILPEHYGSLDIGTRLYEQKLTLGSVLKYYGKSKRASIILDEIRDPNNRNRIAEYRRTNEYINKQPVIVDFYISYEPIKDLILKAELQNVFDKKYIDPLDSNNDSASQSSYHFDTDFSGYVSHLNNFARGRTAVFSLSYKY